MMEPFALLCALAICCEEVWVCGRSHGNGFTQPKTGQWVQSVLEQWSTGVLCVSRCVFVVCVYACGVCVWYVCVLCV